MKALEAYRKAVEEMNIGSLTSELTYIVPSIKSTSLMTRLRSGTMSKYYGGDYNNPFDVLYARFANIKRFYYAIDLVIVYSLPTAFINEVSKEIEFEEPYSITFTNFKKSKIDDWISVDEKRRFADISLDNKQVLHLWNQPVVLKAATDFDKDFQKIWENGELVYEGNNYGDTSDFYIIGSVDRHH